MTTTIKTVAGRPGIHGAGLFGEALNFIGAHVPPRLVQTALVVFLAYHAWDYYAKAQQMAADLAGKAAEAVTTENEATALNTRIGEIAAQKAAAQAELEKLQAEAALAELDVKANAAKINDVPARLAALRAEMELARAEADKADAEQRAQNQIVNGGVRLAVAQRRAEIAGLESEARSKIQALCIMLQTYDGLNDDGSFNFGNIINFPTRRC